MRYFYNRYLTEERLMYSIHPYLLIPLENAREVSIDRVTRIRNEYVIEVRTHVFSMDTVVREWDRNKRTHLPTLHVPKREIV